MNVFCLLSVGPSISPGPFNVTVTTGIRAVLSCETTGIPPPKVSWKRNGTPFDISQQPGAYRYRQSCGWIPSEYKICTRYESLSHDNIKADAIVPFCAGYCPLGLWFFCHRPMRMKVTLSALLSMMSGRSAGSSRSSCKVLILSFVQ